MYRPGEEVHVKGWLRLIGGRQDGDVGLVGGGVNLVDYRIVDAQGNRTSRGSGRTASRRTSRCSCWTTPIAVAPPLSSAAGSTLPPTAVSAWACGEFDAALGEGEPSAYRRLFWEAGAIGQALYLEAEAAAIRGTGIGCFFDDGVHQLLGITDHTLQSLYHFAVGGPVEDSRLTTLPGYPWESR